MTTDRRLTMRVMLVSSSSTHLACGPPRAPNLLPEIYVSWHLHTSPPPPAERDRYSAQSSCAV
ncbi:hypothetical protein C8Q80DRAFT_758031 [Daedaleopsis nitida]|nr:hypothetical protein C8Q80DRAFT_758031 [Daedaleopsis nitida]